MPPHSCQKGAVRTAWRTAVRSRARRVGGRGGAREPVRCQPHRLRRFADDPQREREQDDRAAQADDPVGPSPPHGEDQPHRHGDQEAHAGHRGGAQERERRRAAPHEPPGDHGRADDVTGGRQPQRDQDPVDEGELPHLGDEPGGRERAGEDERAEDRDRPRPPALDEPAHERHEDAVEEQAERDDEGEGAAIGSEIGDDGLEKRPDREADAGREEHHDREGDGDPPSVEDPPPRHDRGHYSRATGPGQPAGPSSPRAGRPSDDPRTIAGTASAPSSGETPRSREGPGPGGPCAASGMDPRRGNRRPSDRCHGR